MKKKKKKKRRGAQKNRLIETVLLSTHNKNDKTHNDEYHKKFKNLSFTFCIRIAEIAVKSIHKTQPEESAFYNFCSKPYASGRFRCEIIF